MTLREAEDDDSSGRRVEEEGEVGTGEEGRRRRGEVGMGGKGGGRGLGEGRGEVGMGGKVEEEEDVGKWGEEGGIPGRG